MHWFIRESCEGTKIEELNLLFVSHIRCGLKQHVSHQMNSHWTILVDFNGFTFQWCCSWNNPTKRFERIGLDPTPYDINQPVCEDIWRTKLQPCEMFIIFFPDPISSVATVKLATKTRGILFKKTLWGQSNALTSLKGLWKLIQCKANKSQHLS